MTTNLVYFIRFICLRSRMRDFANRMKDFPHHWPNASVSAEQMSLIGRQLRKMIDDI